MCNVFAGGPTAWRSAGGRPTRLQKLTLTRPLRCNAVLGCLLLPGQGFRPWALFLDSVARPPRVSMGVRLGFGRPSSPRVHGHSFWIRSPVLPHPPDCAPAWDERPGFLSMGVLFGFGRPSSPRVHGRSLWIRSPVLPASPWAFALDAVARPPTPALGMLPQAAHLPRPPASPPSLHRRPNGLAFSCRERAPMNLLKNERSRARSGLLQCRVGLHR
jgi:hypothetical protein